MTNFKMSVLKELTFDEVLFRKPLPLVTLCFTQLNSEMQSRFLHTSKKQCTFVNSTVTDLMVNEIYAVGDLVFIVIVAKGTFASQTVPLATISSEFWPTSEKVVLGYHYVNINIPCPFRITSSGDIYQYQTGSNIKDIAIYGVYNKSI